MTPDIPRPHLLIAALLLLGLAGALVAGLMRGLDPRELLFAGVSVLVLLVLGVGLGARRRRRRRRMLIIRIVVWHVPRIPTEEEVRRN